MQLLWFWTLACLLMDFMDYLLSCFRQRETERVDKDDTAQQRKHDQNYFRSYADIDVHEEMLSDTVRTNAYRYSILKNYEKIRGKVVADVGAGTGILSVFCVQAGAKKVYAIEASAIADQIRAVVAENNMCDRISVLHDSAEEVELPEKVDVIVSEWMGYSLLYESMLPSVIHFRDKWLKPDGLMLPATASLYIAPFTDTELSNRLDFWSEIRSVYKMSMSSMKQYAQKCISKQVHVMNIPPEALQAHAQKVCHLDLLKVKVKDLQCVKSKFSFRCFGDSVVHGFVTWFDVTFPESITLSTSPYHEETHWSQTAFYMEQPCHVTQDTLISGSVSVQPHPGAARFLDIALTFQVDGDCTRRQSYFMNDCFV
ncbi:protein arginine N-methyltransferase 6-like isoform X2 [Dreissena polymorpha]|uniref:protein arginine N-methyltransferase 6-like isoform X2 n=1 Tax=Dreissena polymorpha TaxID=45954 RepID=UPI00226569B5|nr:protein arginine N-methyltransferase 6-like isoform X2 [Dreissena polymorpha]